MIVKDRLLPPMERIKNHWADQLHALLTDDCFALLAEACRDTEVKEAVRALLVAVAKVRAA